MKLPPVPVLLTGAALAVGGTAIAVARLHSGSSTVRSDSPDPESPLPSKPPSIDLSTVDPDRDFLALSPTNNNSAAVTKDNFLFNLTSLACVKDFFPPLSLSHLYDQPKYMHKSDFADSDFAFNPPAETGTSSGTSACSTINLSRKGLTSLYHSEFTLKNDKVGLALMTGLKTHPSSTRITVHLVHYAVMYRSQEVNPSGGGQKKTVWAPLGGYAWGQRARPLTATSVTFGIPGGPITLAHDTRIIKSNQRFTWTASPTGSPLVTLSSESRTNPGSSAFTLDPFTFMGLSESDAFFEKSGLQLIKYCRTSSPCTESSSDMVKVNTVEVIDK